MKAIWPRTTEGHDTDDGGRARADGNASRGTGTATAATGATATGTGTTAMATQDTHGAAGVDAMTSERAGREQSTDRRVPQRRRILRGRLGGVSVRAAMAAGSWVGFALGLAIGALLGAMVCWFADAALRWQRDLGLTLGVAQNLLPLGDQVAMLETISREWYVVIPLVAFVGGLIWAIIGGLVAGLVAAGYNRASRHAVVLVEVPEAELEHLAQSIGEPSGEPSLTMGDQRPRIRGERLRLLAEQDDEQAEGDRNGGAAGSSRPDRDERDEDAETAASPNRSENDPSGAADEPDDRRGRAAS